MNTFSLREKCHINTNIDTDTFVGIQYENGTITISFPLGYHLSDNDTGLRKDIFLLINTIAKNSDQQKSRLQEEARNFLTEVSFPLQAYLYVVRDFLERGYYKETEAQYKVGKRGKISWAKTIKTQRPYIQDDSILYIDYMTKNSQVNENELITLIHAFCVHESFQKVGWLFTDFIPEKPHIKFQKRLFLSVLKSKMQNTFNDRNRRLFQNMMAIVSWLGDSASSDKYYFGTYRFEYIWEKMIDRVFGIKNKIDFFPHTTWNISGKDYDNALLEPDTIMLWDNKVYVLDAKYYRYGWTRHPGDLPESTSINKQITYGEYIAESGLFDTDGNKPTVYNAFIMPFDSTFNDIEIDEFLLYVGAARSTWKSNKKTYELVHGILLDVKHLMQCCEVNSTDEILDMVRMINQAANVTYNYKL